MNELAQISQQMSISLNALSALQFQSARNTALLSAGAEQINRTEFADLVKVLHAQADTGVSNEVVSVMNSLSETVDADQMKMAEEVLRSGRISGKYSQLTEIYNKQLAIYNLSIGGKI